jgi:drug/metabolite transporter (DMT)-like permease
MNQKVKTIVAFTAIYLVWGSTFYGTSIALKSFPPFMLSALRFIIGGLTLTLYCYFKKEKAPTLNDIILYSFWGIIIFGGGVIAIVWAQQFLPSSLASIIITTPFWFIVLDKSQWHINFKNGWILAGLVAGLIGVILLLSQKSTSSIDGISLLQFKAILVIIGGSFLWVIGSLQLKKKQSQISIYTKTAIHLIAAGIFAGSVSLLSHELSDFNVEGIHSEATIALLYLALVSTTATFMAFVWLLQHKSAVMVSTYSYVNPMVAVFLGTIIGGESINQLQIIAMIIILSGVFIINIPKYRFRIIR